MDANIDNRYHSQVIRFIPALTLLLAQGCVPVWLPPADEVLLAVALRQDPHSTLEGLEAGRTLILDRCANCHAPPTPTVIHDERWPDLLPRMVERAELNAEETARLVAYLEAGADVPPPAD